MSAAYASPSVAQSSTSRALAGGFAALRAALSRHMLYRRTLAELNALTDRELRDLGISRHAVREVAREAALRA